MSRITPKSELILEMIGYLVHQIEETAAGAVISDSLDRVLREELMRLSGELHLATTRLQQLLESMKQTPLRTDEGNIVDTNHN
jgi:uncharacterized protein HemY